MVFCPTRCEDIAEMICHPPKIALRADEWPQPPVSHHHLDLTAPEIRRGTIDTRIPPRLRVPHKVRIPPRLRVPHKVWVDESVSFNRDKSGHCKAWTLTVLQYIYRHPTTKLAELVRGVASDGSKMLLKFISMHSCMNLPCPVWRHHHHTILVYSPCSNKRHRYVALSQRWFAWKRCWIQFILQSLWQEPADLKCWWEMTLRSVYDSKSVSRINRSEVFVGNMLTSLHPTRPAVGTLRCPHTTRYKDDINMIMDFPNMHQGVSGH